MKLRNLFALAFALVASVSMAQAMPDVPADTAIRTGKLANGLTYYVRYNNYPEKHVNFYIAQRVGSIQEEESQRGLAHFLEHMAFNGTNSFPGNGVIDYTRTLGVQFGRDLNAYTSIDQTVYNINDVPSARQSALDSCLLIIKDWANGLLLEGSEIDKERGVIHEEWRLRSSASQRMFERNLEKLYPGSKYGRRMPIGTMEVIDNFKHEEIRNYYHKWYRPDNQAVIVVGDIDVDYTVKKIEEMFGAIPAPAADAAQVVDEQVPDNAEAIIVVDKDKEQQYNIVQVLYKHNAFPEAQKNSALYLIYDYARWCATHMLNNRLNEKSQEPDCPFIQASASDGNYIFAKTKDAFSLAILPKEGQSAEALKAVTMEALRAQKHGFTATEYARTKAEYLSQIEKQYNNRNRISSERFGRMCASHYLEKEPLTAIETEYEMMSQVVPMLPVDMVNQMMAQFVSQNDSNLVVINFNQEKEGAVYPTEAGLKAAIDAAQAEDLAAWVDNVKDEPLIKEMPKKGKIVKEETDKKFDFKTLTLSNGAKVVIKKTDFKEDEILMEAESKGGTSLYDKKDWANTELIGAIVSVSGLGEFSNTELDKALAGKQASVNFNLTPSFEQLSGKSTVKDLETLFQLTYLKMTAIKKDEKSYTNLMKMLETALKNKDLQPEAVFAEQDEYTINNKNWRNAPFGVEELKNVDYDRVLAIAKERTANAADFTFYFIGNFDEAVLRGYIEQYIASLPGDAKKRENYKNVTERPAGNLVNKFTKKMETPKAIGRMYWYSTTAPYTLENSILARAAGQVLGKIYLQKIREDAGAAYSAGATGGVRLFGDKVFTSIMGHCPMKPDMAEEALRIMRDELTNMAKTVDEGTVNEIKALMLKDADEAAKENSHWMNVINMYVARGIDNQTDYKAIVSSLTPAKISAFIKNVILKAGNHVEVIMLPENK
ncbi:MAG: insulinase family protein [Bacteroidales bacterium]|nr:insulinase family protein [Bacteroidales bacterium]